MAAPFRSSVMTVEPAWIDYNGHLNMAYYHVLFDRGVDEMLLNFGLGLDYLKAHNASYFTAECHVSYKRELPVHAPVYTTLRVVDFDAKRLHYMQELHHAGEEWLSAVGECLVLHVDMGARKVTPWPEDIRRRIEAAKAAHDALPPHPLMSRRIAIPH